MAVHGIKEETAKQGSPRKEKLKAPSKKKRKRPSNDSDEQTKSSVMKRAEEIQAKIAPQFPSMIKYMLPSHVTGGFWLGLPKQFCEKHLPKQDTVIVLEDENGIDYETKYLSAKTGLSGGWRGFSIAHHLVEGDAVVFRLVKPTKLKVYIVRANGSREFDCALGLLELEASREELSYDDPAAGHIEEVEESMLLKCKQEPDNQTRNKTSASANSGLITDQSEHECEDGDVIGFRLSDSVVEFKEVKSFKDFEILTNGLVINQELSKHFRTKYYDLCCSKRTYLHENLLEGLNCKLSAGVIAETINIADAIRASKPTTPGESFTTWRMTLEAFKKLGMKVDFLLDRLDRLIDIAAKSRKYEQVKTARTVAEEEMRNLEKKIWELDQQLLEMNCEDYGIVFEQVAKAHW